MDEAVVVVVVVDGEEVGDIIGDCVGGSIHWVEDELLVEDDELF